MKDRDDGGLVVTLNVCHDWALRAWVLGFGPDAHVVSPLTLAKDVFDAVSDTRRRYLRRESQFAVVALRAG